MSFREKGKKNRQYPHALPVASVDTMEEAESLRILTCRLMYDGSRFTITEGFGFVRGDADSLSAAGEKLEELYQQMKARRSET